MDLLAGLTEEEKEIFYAEIGWIFFNSVNKARTVGHKDPLSTLRSYLKPEGLANQFVYDLFHKDEVGGVEGLYAKWSPHAEPPGQAFAYLVGRKK